LLRAKEKLRKIYLENLIFWGAIVSKLVSLIMLKND
jgi:hypothetical protein